MRRIIGLAVDRSLRVTLSVVVMSVALCLLSSCLPIRSPRTGEAVAIQPGEGLVFGRLRMVSAQNENIEYAAFWFDPWDQPFFGPGPRMTLEVRQHNPGGRTFKYKARPAPVVEKNGYFHWILRAGDYVLLGNPRLLGSPRFTPEETVSLARFTVPASGGTIYLGTLIVSIDFDFGNVIQGWERDEAEYEIRGFRVEDAREGALSQLRERFPVIPEPVVIEHMRIDNQDGPD